MDCPRSRSALRLFASTVVAGVLLATGSAGGQMLGDPGARNTAPPPQAGPPPPNGVPGNGVPGNGAPWNGAPGNGAPLNFDAVMASAYSQTAFTFDRTMLQATDSFFAGGDPETRRVLAGLNSVTVRNYRAQEFARYDAGALAMIDGQMRGSGWKHLVNANGKGSATMTDLWLHFAGSSINDVTVLTRGDRNMSVISVDCTLRPLDLLHLSGHFGIPKVDENAVMVPAH